MPGMNRRGPTGEGPRTGRGLGRCNDESRETSPREDEEFPRGMRRRQRRGGGGGWGGGGRWGHGRGFGRGRGRFEPETPEKEEESK